MPRVLIVDDDYGMLETFQFALRRAGHLVETAHDAANGLRTARAFSPHIVFLDLRLPDGSGLDVLRILRSSGCISRFFIVTGFASIQSAVEAAKLGAENYLEKPVSIEHLLALVEEKNQPDFGPQISLFPELHADHRWALMVVQIVKSPADLRTVDAWARLLHVARATLEKHCHAAGLHAKPSLDFARVLRAILHARRTACTVDAFLDGDPRTIRRLSAAAGCEPAQASIPNASPVAHFLGAQRFITKPQAIAAIRSLLQTSVIWAASIGAA